MKTVAVLFITIAVLCGTVFVVPSAAGDVSAGDCHWNLSHPSPSIRAWQAKGYRCYCPCSSCAIDCVPRNNTGGSASASSGNSSASDLGTAIGQGLGSILAAAIFGGGSSQAQTQSAGPSKEELYIQEQLELVRQWDKRNKETGARFERLAAEIASELNFDTAVSGKDPVLDPELSRVHLWMPGENTGEQYDVSRSPEGMFDTSAMSALRRGLCSARLLKASQAFSAGGQPELAALYAKDADLARDGQFIRHSCLAEERP